MSNFKGTQCLPTYIKSLEERQGSATLVLEKNLELYLGL